MIPRNGKIRLIDEKILNFIKTNIDPELKRWFLNNIGFISVKKLTRFRGEHNGYIKRLKRLFINTTYNAQGYPIFYKGLVNDWIREYDSNMNNISFKLLGPNGYSWSKKFEGNNEIEYYENDILKLSKKYEDGLLRETYGPGGNKKTFRYKDNGNYLVESYKGNMLLWASENLSTGEEIVYQDTKKISYRFYATIDGVSLVTSKIDIFDKCKITTRNFFESNKLIKKQVEYSDGRPDLIITYIYDDKGNRIKKTITKNGFKKIIYRKMFVFENGTYRETVNDVETLFIKF